MPHRVPDAPPAYSIVVAVRDEAENILPVIDEVVGAMDAVTPDYELVFVDDGSVDATPQRLLEVMRREPRLRVLRHERPWGKSSGVVTGVRAARAPWIIMLDGDGQNDPRDIPALLAALPADPAASRVRLVCGRRLNRRDTWLKRVSSRTANAVRRRVLRDGTPDTGCGFKIVRRDVFMSMPQFHNMHRFLPALVQRAGWESVSVGVNDRARLSGRSKYGLHNRLWVGIRDMIGVAWLLRRPVCEAAAVVERPALSAGAPPGPPARVVTRPLAPGARA